MIGYERAAFGLSPKIRFFVAASQGKLKTALSALK